MPFRPRATLTALLALAAAPALACSVTSTGLRFGTIDPLAGQAATATASVNVDCPEAGGYTLTVSPGHGDYAERYLLAGERRLFYNVYADPAHGQVVGDGGGVSVAVSGDGPATTHTLHGLMPAQPGAVPGVYTDQLVITVSY
ncbi:spore coat protein U domain-containing protein [Alloalcanivorax marinus]|uniref:spore coat protein U domain-containing protein n=1 Tax=Alloalcanivorax marinus TaxID=1177169 RepID=UPI0019336B24|nr:spore coat protein U domain-containing protein [Alloalcanivorax marinus]MBL7249291.1 spore coat protein U domain-containing protein [Alloalcanivorax marinus]